MFLSVSRARGLPCNNCLQQLYPIIQHDCCNDRAHYRDHRQPFLERRWHRVSPISRFESPIIVALNRPTMEYHVMFQKRPFGTGLEPARVSLFQEPTNDEPVGSRNFPRAEVTRRT